MVAGRLCNCRVLGKFSTTCRFIFAPAHYNYRGIKIITTQANTSKRRGIKISKGVIIVLRYDYQICKTYAEEEKKKLCGKEICTRAVCEYMLACVSKAIRRFCCIVGCIYICTYPIIQASVVESCSNAKIAPEACDYLHL